MCTNSATKHSEKTANLCIQSFSEIHYHKSSCHQEKQIYKYSYTTDGLSDTDIWQESKILYKNWMPSPKVIKPFSCSTQLSMKFSLLINMKMPTTYLLAEKFSCSDMFTKKDSATVSNLRFISRTNFMLSWVEQEKKSFTISAPGSYSGKCLTCNAKNKRPLKVNGYTFRGSNL